MKLETVLPAALPKPRNAARGTRISKCRQKWTPTGKLRHVTPSSSSPQSRSPTRNGSSTISIDAGTNDYAVSESTLPSATDSSQDHVMQGWQSPRTLYNRAPHLPRSMVGDRPWRPGDPQDTLCYVCRDHCTSVACATCPRVYHPQCLTPPLDPSDILTPWFCPVCVERGWHELDLDLTPLSQLTDPLTTAPSTFQSYDSNFMQQETGQSQSAMGPYIEQLSSHAVMQNPNIEVSVHNDGTVAQNLRSDDRALQIIPPSPPSVTAVSLEEVSQAIEILDSRANPSAKGRQKNNAISSTAEGISSGLFTFRVETSQSTSVTAAQSRSGPTVSVSAQQQANGAVRRITTRRSRYSTLPSHLDQSVTALIDELESTTVLRDTIQHLEEKVNRLEQGLKIEEGRARLAQQEEHERLAAENAAMRRELMSKTEEICTLRDQRQQISEELETLKSQVAERNEDMASCWRIMKTIMHE